MYGISRAPLLVAISLNLGSSRQEGSRVVAGFIAAALFALLMFQVQTERKSFLGIKIYKMWDSHARVHED